MKIRDRMDLLRDTLNRKPSPDAEEVHHAHKLLEDIEDRLAAYEQGLSWIAKTCRQEIPLGYSERMRVVLLRHLAERAERAMK